MPFVPINFATATATRAALAEGVDDMTTAAAEAKVLRAALPWAASRTAATPRRCTALSAAGAASATRFTAAAATASRLATSTAPAIAVADAWANRRVGSAATIKRLTSILPAVAATSTAAAWLTAAVAATSRFAATSVRVTTAAGATAGLAAIAAAAATTAAAVVTAAAIEAEQAKNVCFGNRRRERDRSH
jgi:hypothetical protein